MLQKILPIVFLILGSSVGVGAGIYLRVPIEDTAKVNDMDDTGEVVPKDAPVAAKNDTKNDVPVDYVKLSNQFVVPIVTNNRVSALVVMSLSLEVPEEQRSFVFRHEPKLRDSFLEVLFDHANIGGFDGAFTETKNLETLRRALTETGRRDIGKGIVKDVLITEIARQDY